MCVSQSTTEWEFNINIAPSNHSKTIVILFIYTQVIIYFLSIYTGYISQAIISLTTSKKADQAIIIFYKLSSVLFQQRQSEFMI